MPAGGLSAQIIGGLAVHLFSGSKEVDLTGNTAADGQNLQAFFNAADGQAGLRSFAGTMAVAGQTISGSFSLSEFGATGGVQVVVAGASTQMGTGQGVGLANANGAFALLPVGAAGVVKTDASASSNRVVGVTGLSLTAAAGLTFEVNQTGAMVAKTVTTPGGNVSISFATGASVVDVAGAADFKVAGPTGTALRVGGSFVMTDPSGGTGLSIAGQQVAVDLYDGATRAVTTGSASASFTLGTAGFALTPGTFTAGAFTPIPGGQPIAAGTGNYPSSATKLSATLGPISLQGVSPALSSLSFGPSGLVANVGLSADSASLSFTKAGAAAATGDSPMGASATGLTGTFALAGAVDPTTGVVSHFSAPGTFAFTAATFDLNVPKVLDAAATGLAINYDPTLTGSQQIFAANSVTVNVPALKLQGLFTTTSANPALIVRTDGFSFDQGTVRNTSQDGISVGGTVKVFNPFVTLGNFSFSRTAGVSLGSFAIGADKLSVGSDTSKIKADGSTVVATLGFDNAGAIQSFTLSAGTVNFSAGSLLTFAGANLAFAPLATGTDPVFSVGSATATVSVAAVGLKLTGTATNLSVGADGSVLGPDALSVAAAFDSTTAAKLHLPSYLPFSIDALGVKWNDFRNDPSHFLIDVSAQLHGKFGPVQVDGSVDTLEIDPDRLADGQNPIVGLAGFSVGATGNLFGGTISGSLIAGVIKLDTQDNILPDDAQDFASTIFFGGIKASFHFANIGASILVGFDEKGLLEAYLGADIPVLLDPVSGLALGNFRGGVSFNATPLPIPNDPSDLAAPIFQPTAKLTDDQWLSELRQQVVNQVAGGSRIFTAVLGVPDIVNELNSGTVAVGGPTDTAFTANNKIVTDVASPATVTTLTAGLLWEIDHDGSVYYVQKVDDSTLNVSEVRFNLATATAAILTSSSTSHTVPSQLIADFAAQNVLLSATAQVSQIQGGDVPAIWQVVDGDNTFIVSTMGSGSTARLAVTGGGASFGQMNNVMRIEAGATLYDEYASENAFTADVDIIITTDGKVLIDGNLTLAKSVTADIKMFADLSSIGQSHPNTPLKLVFLAQMPAPTGDVPALVTLKGTMSFAFRDANGDLVNPVLVPPSQLASFEFDILGQAIVGSPDTAALVFGGSAGASGGYAELKLTVQNSDAATEVRLDMSGSLSVQGIIEAGDLVSAAGTLIIDKAVGQPVEAYGAVELNLDSNSPGLAILRNAGLAAQADILLALNTSTRNRDLTLTLPGRQPEDLKLAPATLELQGSGTLTFQNKTLGLGADIAFVGAFAARISVDVAGSTSTTDPTVRGDGGVDIDLFVVGKLDVGLSVGNNHFDLLDLDGQGLVAIRDIGAVYAGHKITDPPEIAARVDLGITQGVPGVFEASGSAQLLLNTFGHDFTYVIPARLHDTIAALDQLRNMPGAGATSLPALTGDSITVPGAPPRVLATGSAPAAGPYFALQFGNPNHVAGMSDVSLKLLNTFQLAGNFQVVAASGSFQMTADATASIVLPGAEDILDAEATGVLSITNDGLFGGLGIQSKLALPGSNIGFSADTTTYLGINTTSQAHAIPFSVGKFVSPTIAAQSGAIYVGGSLQVGALSVAGSFQLQVGAQALSLDVDGSINVAGIPALSVTGSAAIDYGLPPAQDGLVLHAGLTLGDGATIGVPGVFEIGGSLQLDLDTRPASYLVQIQVNKASVDVLNAIDFAGSADITFAKDPATQVPYFSVSASLSANFLNVLTVSASGSFDSRGYFDLNLKGHLGLGTDSFGISADASFFLVKTETDPLDFGGSVSGSVRAFGVTLAGANIAISYDGYGPGEGQTGEIGAHASVTVIGITKDVDFTLGYLTLDAAAAPKLASVDDNGNVTLNVGPNQSKRAYRNDDADEAYTIDSIGPGTHRGEMVQVQAFGVSQTFDDVMSINGDFGSGRDQLLINPTFGSFATGTTLGVNIKGEGQNQFINESTRPVVFDASGSSSDDILQSSGAGSKLYGGSGNDYLYAGGVGNTLLGNGGDDTIQGAVGAGISIIDGGAGNNTLLINGTAGADNFTLDGGAAGLTVGTSAGSITAGRVGTLKISGLGGADTATVNVAGLAAAGVTTVDLDLSRFQATSTADPNVETLIDDGAADSVAIVGTAAADTFATGALNGDVTTTWSVAGQGPLTIDTQQPGATDTITINAGDGNDTFDVTGQIRGLIENGQGGDDTFDQSIGAATVDGGLGSNAANFEVQATDYQNVTLTAAQIYAAGTTAAGSASLLTALTNLATIAVKTDAAAGRVTIQATKAGATSVELAAGSSLDVKATSGPLNVRLDGNASALLETTGGTTTATGTSGAGSTLTVGKGLLARIGGVTSTNVDNVAYDDTQDGTGRTATLSSTALNLSGRAAGAPLTLAGAKSIAFSGGLGNDAINVAAGPANFTINGGAGIDALAVALAGSPSGIGTVTAGTGVESASFASATTDPIDWVLTGQTLASGGKTLLDASAVANSLAVTLGNGAQTTLGVGQVSLPTTVNLGTGGSTVTVGGGLYQLDSIAKPLTLTSSAASNLNSLILDDTAVLLDKARTIGGGTVTGTTQGGAISYAAGKFGSLQLKVGTGQNTVTLANGQLASTTITGNAASTKSTTVVASGDVGNLTFNGGGGADLLQIIPGPRANTVTYTGGANPSGMQDRLIIDDPVATPATGGLAGVAGGKTATLQVDNLMVNLNQQVDVEAVTINLGAGNDQFTIDAPTTYTLPSFTLNGGAGDDTINVVAVNGTTGSYLINGGLGSDTIKLAVSKAPTAGMFAAINPQVENLIVDASTSADHVDWSVDGSMVLANNLDVIDSSGAGVVNITGGSKQDTLTVSGGDNRPINAVVNGSTVNLTQGSVVLSQLQAPTTPTPYAGTVDGLAGAKLVASTPDGSVVFASGTGSGIAKFRRDGASGALVYLGTFQLPAGNPNALAVTPDGKQLLAADDQGSFYAYNIDAATGITGAPTITIGSSPADVISQLVVSPDGKEIVTIGTNLLGNNPQSRAASIYLRNPDTGAIPIYPSGGIGVPPAIDGRCSFSSDSTRFYAPSTSGSVAIYSITSSGKITPISTVANGKDGLKLKSSTQTQISADGTLLFTYSPGDGTVNYYSISADNDPAKAKYLGSIGGVGGAVGDSATSASSNVFKYDDKTQFLMSLGSNGTKVNAYKLDMSSKTFASIWSLQLDGAAESLDVGAIPSSGSVLVVSSPQENDASSKAEAFSINSDGTPPSNTPIGTVTPPTNSFTFTGPVGVIRSLHDGQYPSFIAAYDKKTSTGGISGGYEIFIAADGSTYQESTYNNAQVMDFEVYKNPVAAGDPTTGLSSFWLAIEKSPDGQATNLVAYHLTETEDGSTYVNTTIRQSLNGYGLDAANRIRISNDGSRVYILGSQGETASIPCTMTSSGGLQLDFTNIKIGTYSNFNLGDVAIANGKVYGVNGSTAGLYILTPTAAGNPATFDDPNAAPIPNGFNAYDLTGASAVASSADDSVLYVATTTGNLVTVRLDPSTGTVTALGTINYAGPTTTTNNGTDILRYGATGGELVVSAAGTGKLYSFTLGSNNLPTTDSTSNNGVGSLRFQGAQDLALSSSALYVASSGAASLVSLPLVKGLASTTGSQVIVEGQSFSVPIAGLGGLAVAPNNLFAYGVSPTDNAVAVLNRTTGVWTPFINGYNNVTGLLGVSLVAAAVRGSTSLGYAISPSSGTLSIFSGASLLAQATRPEFKAAEALVVSADGLSLYVSTSTSVYRFALANGSMTSATTPSSSGSIDNIDSFRLGGTAGHLYALDSTDGDLWTLDPITTAARALVEGLNGVTGLTVVGTDIYAIAPSLTRLYHLTDTSSLQLAGDTYSNGRNFVQGLDGASAVAASGDGRYVFVASQTDGTIAVFSRNSTTGALSFVQLVRDGRGADGITQPTALAVVGTTLTVATAAGRNGTAGGLSFLDISAAAIPPPSQFLTTFTPGTMSALTVAGGTSTDIIRVIQAPGAIPLTINGNGGGDVVNLADLGPQGASTTVNFNTGSNELDVNQSFARTLAGNLTANGGSGADTFNIQALTADSVATINANKAPAAVDVIRVAGAGIASGASVVVDGLTAPPTGPVTGPVLFYNGNEATVSAGATTSGTISLDGHGTVSFNNMNYAPAPHQVFVLSPPQPTFTITPLKGTTPSEGVGVTLKASDLAGLSGVTYAWDIDGDGQFTDATGPTVTLSWAQLVALGIDTRGSYPIAVRATTTQDPQQFAGQSYQASADFGRTLTVADTLPAVTVAGAPATLGRPYTLAFSAKDYGLDRVTGWTVDWGDGTPASSVGSGDVASGADPDGTPSFNYSNAATHTYITPGNYTATVTALEGAIAGVGTATIAARPGSTTLGLDSGSYNLAAGTDLDAAVVTAAPAASYTWQILQGTTVVRTLAPTTASLAVAWADLGLTTAGSYTLAVIGTYGGGGTATTSAPLTVTAVAPTATFTASVDAIPQGSAGGTITLTVADIVDPAPGAAPRYTVDYDFNDDGTIDLANQGLVVAIPASFLTTPGAKVARAVLKSASGLSTDLTVAYTVTPVAPTLTLSSPTAILEGGTASVTPTLTGPGVTVSSWRFDYGDGQVDVVADPRLSFAQTHRYLNNKPDGTPYTITVTASTNSGDVTQTTTVAVGDVPPTVALTQLTPTVTEGVPNSLQLGVAVTDPGSDTVASYTINWGDGNVETFGGDVTRPTHTYASTAFPAASFPVTVTALTNNDGTFTNQGGSLANTLNVAVADVAPSIVPSLTRAPTTGSQGTTLTFGVVATSVATGTKPLTFTWTVTDPTGAVATLPATAATTTPVPSAFPVPVQYATGDSNSFTPFLPGSYKVGLVVADGRGGSNTYSWTVAVADVAPVIQGFTVPTTGTAGQPILLVGSATDAGGSADPLTFTWTVTEQATGVVQTLSGASTRFTPRGGRYVVQLAVADSFGKTTTQAAPISVANPGPSIAAGAFVVPGAGLEGGQASFSVAATDPGGSSGLTYSWRVAGPSGSLTTLTGPTVAYTYTIPGSYAVSVTVADAVGQSILASATVLVTNVAPTIGMATVPATGSEGVAIPFTATASDPGGAMDPLSYAWTVVGPTGTTVLTGPAPQFTPPDDGTYTVSLAVTDAYNGTASRAVGTIRVADVAPVLGAIVVPAGPFAEGQMATFAVGPAADVAADQATLRYDWTVTGPGGLVRSFPDQGLSLPFVFPDDGSYAVAVTATDKDGLSSAASTATVEVADVAPIITGFAIPTTGYVGRAIPLVGAATDVPADLPKLVDTWTITPPTGAPFTLEGATPRFTPTMTGTYVITLTVDDTDGGTQARSGTINVKASPITLAPLVLPTDATEGARVALIAAATDDLGGTFNYTWTVTGPDGLPVAVTGQGANVSFLPPDNGAYRVTVVASTPNGSGSAAGSVAVANVAPTLTQVTTPASAAIGVPSLLAAVATDPAGPADPLTYTWTITSPAGATLATLTGAQVSFTPPRAGIYGINLTVDDGDGGVATATRLLPALYLPPVAAAGGPYSVPEGGSVQLDALAGSFDTNQPATTLTYAWDFTGDGRYADATGPDPVFSAANLDGPSAVTGRVRVTDGHGDVAYAGATIQVVNVAPTITGLTPSSGTISVGGSVSLAGTIADPGRADTHVVSVDWGDGSAATQVDLAAGVTSFSTPGHVYVDSPSSGSATIRVTVTDKDHAASPVATQVVRIANVAPTATITGDSGGVFGQARTFTLAATDPSPALTAAGFRLVVAWGDGTTDTFTGATARVATHTFAAAGTFTVELSATAEDGETSPVATRAVTITPATPTFILTAPGSTFDGTQYHLASGQVFGVGGVSLGAATLTYYLASDTALARPLAAAPTDAGTYLVVASSATSGNYAAARSAPLAFAVAQRATTVTIIAVSAPATAANFATDYPKAKPTPKKANQAKKRQASPTEQGTKPGSETLPTSKSRPARGERSKTIEVAREGKGKTTPKLRGQTPAEQLTVLTATVTTGSGVLSAPVGAVVQFQANGLNLGSPVPVAADGTATLFLPIAAGNPTITATFGGDPNNLGSTSGPADRVVYGPGAYAVGSTLLLVGSNFGDSAQINPITPQGDGTTGLHVNATLNNTRISQSFGQSFTAISIVGYNGNDNFRLAGSLTLALTVAEGSGNNHITAAGGNDTFALGTGSNHVTGGTGSKTVVARDAAGTTSQYSFGAGDHSLHLGNGAHQVAVGEGTNIMVMGAGHDSIVTGSGTDAIILGDGNDHLRLGNGAKSIRLGNGFHAVQAGNGPVVLTAGDGKNTVHLGDGGNTVRLGDGPDTLVSGAGNNTVTVGNGTDHVRLGNGDNVVIAGSGSGQIVAGNGANLVVGGVGRHSIRLGTGNDILIDGTATLDRPGDSFRQILQDWDASPSTAVNNRIKVTTNRRHPNALLASSGRDWFFSDTTNKATFTKKATDRLN